MSLKRYFRLIKLRKANEIDFSMDTPEENLHFEKGLQQRLVQIQNELGHSPDVIVRSFQTNFECPPVAVVYMEGLTDQEKVNHFIGNSLLVENPLSADMLNDMQPKDFFEFIKSRTLAIGEIGLSSNWNHMVSSILSGELIVLVDGFSDYIIANLQSSKERSIMPPETEINIRGPKDSFTETIGTNISLIRRRLKSPNLWLESMNIGTVSNTKVAIMYLQNVAEGRHVEEIKKRLKDIRIDAILESGYIEDLVKDDILSPFPTVFNSERPDVVAGNLLEGRIAVLVDGTPNTLILPTTFSQFFKAAEDYYQRFDFTIFMRAIRYLSFFIVILVPSIYIAVTAYHHEMIPTLLVINLLAQREGVPFPVVIEALLMEIAFEIMREAGTRMPRAVGQAVSIVGAVVLGQAAVQAGIVTAMMVIIVSLTGIASFTLPGYTLTNAARLIRFPFMLAASTLGFYGIIIAMIMLVAHLTSLKSFGVPYMSPFSPFDLKDQQDTIWRSPLQSRTTRPQAPDLEPAAHSQDAEDATSSSSAAIPTTKIRED
ncbi:spore germination protein [Paenibacillus silvae]|uniref:Spore germination protein n=1 Tax=Paenibacillus silvae TaxID=1325358 RepID=A0A2W6NM48_9BACL|nr:spore germination protein [Paenibacillus silvae]PZT56889.1 spore germination protein [Paenibacillus silvae]